MLGTMEAGTPVILALATKLRHCRVMQLIATRTQPVMEQVTCQIVHTLHVVRLTHMVLLYSIHQRLLIEPNFSPNFTYCDIVVRRFSQFNTILCLSGPFSNQSIYILIITFNL